MAAPPADLGDPRPWSADPGRTLAHRGVAAPAEHDVSRAARRSAAGSITVSATAAERPLPRPFPPRAPPGRRGPGRVPDDGLPLQVRGCAGPSGSTCLAVRALTRRTVQHRSDLMCCHSGPAVARRHHCGVAAHGAAIPNSALLPLPRLAPARVRAAAGSPPPPAPRTAARYCPLIPRSPVLHARDRRNLLRYSVVMTPPRVAVHAVSPCAGRPRGAVRATRSAYFWLDAP